MLKRAFDIVFSAGWLIGFAPLLLVVAILVRLKLGSPVLFIQERPGLRAKPFRMVKFRTMTDELGPDGELLPDEQRLTSFGKFLRSTTLDEFPEMWNVLLGDMSVVGPRPLLMRYVSRYSPFQARRMEVSPVLPVGRRSTAAIPSAGKRSSPSMSGMSTTAPSGSI